MKTKRQNLSDTRVKLTIELDAAELSDGEKVALVHMARELKVPGFRKGKVPASVAAKHVDQQQLSMEALEHAISKAVATAFADEDIQVLERPEVEVAKYVAGEMAEFTAEADMLPEVKLANYKKLSIPKLPEISVKKSEVDEIVNRIKAQMATRKTVKREAKLGDELTIDFVGKKDGKAFDGGTAADHVIILGSHSFIDGFESGLVGHKAGDKVELDLTFPKEYHAPELAGVPVTFEVEVKKVDEIVEPEENDELAAKLGPFTSMKEIRDDIKREITERERQSQSDKMRDELVRQVVDSSDVAVPKVLHDDQLASLEQDIRQNATYQGKSFETWLADQGFKDRDDWAAKEGGKTADLRIKTGLVLAELSKVEKITAAQDEVTMRVEALKQQYASQPETVKQLDTPDVQRSIANQVLTEKTIDRLVELSGK